MKPTLTSSSRGTVKSLLACAALGLCLAAPQSARAASVEERLDQLEQKLSSLTQENAVLKKQLGYDAKGAPGAAIVTAIGKESKLAVGGYLHLQGEVGDAADSRFPTNDRFLMRKARLGVKGSITPVVDFLLQADLGSNSLDPKVSSYRLQAADILVTWKAHSAANLSVGQFKTPFGYEFNVGDTKTISMERALVSDLLTVGRQAGAMVFGGILDKRLTYSAAITNGNPVNNNFNDNDQFAYTGRVSGIVVQSEQAKFAVGTSAFSSRDTGTQLTGVRTGHAVDAQLSFLGAELSGEWIQARYNRDSGADYKADGWSVMGAYFILPKRLQAFARYETFDPNTINTADHTDLRTIGFNYLIKGDDLKLSLNYLIGSPPTAAKHQDRLIARVQVIY